MLNTLIKEIEGKTNPEKSKIYQRFFKTGPGDYAQGDLFLGLTVPDQRKLAQKYIDLPLTDIETLLYNPYHEYRLIGFFILVYKYQRDKTKNIIDFYLKHKNRANNWDLIDCIADKLLGKYLLDKDKKILYDLAKSDNLWDRRIAIISTFEFIRNHHFETTLEISKILLKDQHDLIHKAVGWMLREVGKRNQDIEENFLDKFHQYMPRTMLRYSIEKFSPEKREYYLKKY
jgi:3-methyladenine DNA glycosylase AlkD